MKIEPALTKEQWAETKDHAEGIRGAPELNARLVGDYPDDCAAMMAKANYLLLDDDPRKISRAAAKAIRFIIEQHFWDDGPTDEGWQSEEMREAERILEQHAAAIEALLPPTE
jgi:hypothetical protein